MQGGSRVDILKVGKLDSDILEKIVFGNIRYKSADVIKRDVRVNNTSPPKTKQHSNPQAQLCAVKPFNAATAPKPNTPPTNNATNSLAH